MKIRASLKPARILWVIATIVLVLGLSNSPAAPDKDVDAEVRKLIDNLGDANIPHRYQAAKRLVEIGRPAIGPLRKAAAGHPNEDIRVRAAVVARDVEQALFTVIREFDGHATEDWRNRNARVAVLPDGKHILSCNNAGMILWDVETGQVVRAMDDLDGSGSALAISRDGTRAIRSGGDRIGHVWDLATGREVRKLVGHAQPIWGVALTADGKRAITGSLDRSIRVWDVESGKQVQSFPVDDRVHALTLSPDDRWVAASHFTQAARPGTLRLWDMASGKLIRSFEGHKLPITAVTFSRDGKTIVTACLDGTVRFWDAESGKETRKFAIDEAQLQFAVLSDDGSTLITGGSNPNVVRLWDVPTGTLLYSSDPFAEGFLSAAILPDSHRAAVAGQDGVIRLWRWK